jgi:serine/threonine protein kinase
MIRRRSRPMEWEILKQFRSHPNIVELIDLYESDDEVHMILECCPGGELFELIQRKRNTNSLYRANELQASKITFQILSALKEIHDRGIIHRDVKPENILLINNETCEVKICDFGIAVPLFVDFDADAVSSDDEGTFSSRRRAYSRVGSDFYAAPEVGLGYGYGSAVDIYSLGITIYVLLYGFPPVIDFSKDSESDILFPDIQGFLLSEDAKNLIRQMLVADPDQRITISQALSSKWIKRYNESQSHRPARCESSNQILSFQCKAIEKRCFKKALTLINGRWQVSSTNAKKRKFSSHLLLKKCRLAWVRQQLARRLPGEKKCPSMMSDLYRGIG